MNNKHLSLIKEINTNFIIASRAYFLQSPTCTRVNNLDYNDSNTHGVLVLIMFCSWKRLSQRVCDIQIRMYFANLYVPFRHLMSDGIEASLDVLGPLVKSGFLCQGNCTSIVTKDFHWTRCTRYDT